MKTIITLLSFLFLSFCLTQASETNQSETSVYGRVTSGKEPIDYALVYLKDTKYGTNTDENGRYKISAPAGKYTIVVSFLGYYGFEKEIILKDNNTTQLDISLKPNVQELDEVTVISDGVTRINKSAYNAIAIDTKALQNSTQSLSDALAKAPGIKIRETGGVGSDTQLMMDGFTGKHIKIFVDGIPQEGVGSSFGINNIPVNYADRIEIYKGVVPVGFGTDAIGGVINIVTKKHNSNTWFFDGSYSYGSFNTHKSYINFGQTFKSGLTYEINAFQNYSDNNYYVNTAVKEFIGDTSSSLDMSKIEKVKRFHDNYHNEAVLGKIGFINQTWADRLMLGFTYSNMYKEIQTGVRQEIVYGQKHRKSHSLMPSLEYSKLDVIPNLDVFLTANYNKNITNNIDTASYEYNWRGEKRPLKQPGEQSYQYTRSTNNNWNGTATVNYRLGESHLFTLNHMLNSFQRSNKSMLNQGSEEAIKKETQKNITGLSYRFTPFNSWNISVFGKLYNQHVSGPIATTSAQDDYQKTSSNINNLGYGAATTYFILPNLQTKLSYEKAYRLPTVEEMFGDEDLEKGNIQIKPENSNNLNFNVSYNFNLKEHSILLEGGLIYRDTRDYIQRVVESGTRPQAGYANHGKVLTKGYSLSVRYSFSNWLSVGGTYSEINARENEKSMGANNSQQSITYKARISNLPYRLANSDITFYWHKLGRKTNMLTVTYDNQYTHSFPLNSEVLGSQNKAMVPSQFSHNIRLSYAIQNGKYNLTFECKNLTDEKMYDNYSLQKPGRAFYGKFRVFFGGK